MQRLADLLRFPSSPAPAIFQFPFPLPFSHFVAVSTRVELPRRREVSNDLTEHSPFGSQALMWAFMIVAACLSHILVFLEDKTPCKRHCLQNRRYRFFFAFCRLARRRAQSMRPARSASYSRGGGGEALPSNRLMGMCRWMGSHFHDWIDYNGVAFSTELLEWGRISSGLWGKNILASSKFGY